MFKNNLNKLSFLLIICAILLNQRIFGAKTVVNIDGIAQEFDSSTSCAVKFWGNKQENSCKCCLIKHANELTKGKTANDILKYCTEEKKYCSTDIINNLTKQEKIVAKDKETAIKDLINSVYSKSVIIKEINPIGISFDRDDNFTEESVVKFLELAFAQKALTNPDFKSASCLKAKDIIGQKGYKTNQLFLITSTCSGKTSEYILKDLTTGTTEILRLQKSALLKELAPYVYPNYISGYPSYVLPIAYLSYNYKGTEHYISLMPKAPGRVLLSLVKDYRNNKISEDELKKVYQEVGRAMGLIHQKFMPKYKELAKSDSILNKTIIHGDDHQDNIFYDKDTNRVIFIDNERLATYSPGDPIFEIMYFFYTTILFVMPAELRNDINFLKKWLPLAKESFIQGYISSFDPSKRDQVLKEIQSKINLPKYIQEFIAGQVGRLLKLGFKSDFITRRTQDIISLLKK